LKELQLSSRAFSVTSQEIGPSRLVSFLKDKEWLLKLTYLIDVMNHLNVLNFEMEKEKKKQKKKTDNLEKEDTSRQYFHVPHIHRLSQ
jgi:hypothetical protein